MADYGKMTADSFIKELSEKYDNPTNAKRAVARSQLSDKDKDKCRAAIDKHFGVAASTPASGRKSKVGKKKAGKKVKAKAAPSGPPKGRKKTAKKVSGRRRPAARASAPETAEASAAAPTADAPEAVEVGPLGNLDPLRRIGILETVVASASHAIAALDFGSKQLQDKTAVEEGILAASTALTGAMNEMTSTVNRLASEAVLMNHPSTVHSPEGAAESFARARPPTNGLGQVPGVPTVPGPPPVPPPPPPTSS